MTGAIEQVMTTRRELVMVIVHERSAGIDISKRDSKVAVRTPAKRTGAFATEVTTWGSTTGQIFELVDSSRRRG